MFSTQAAGMDAYAADVPAWAVLGLPLLALLIAVVFTRSYLTRVKYDMHKIPLAPGAVPILGKSAVSGISRLFDDQQRSLFVHSTSGTKGCGSLAQIWCYLHSVLVDAAVGRMQAPFCVCNQV